MQKTPVQWLKHVFANLSEEEKQDFQGSVESIHQEERGLELAKNAWKDWKESRINLEKNPDMQLHLILEWKQRNPEYNSKSLARENPRAAAMLRKHLQQTEISLAQIDQTRRFLDQTTPTSLQKQNAALLLVAEYGTSLQRNHPELWEKISNHTQTFRKELEEMTWPPSPEELLQASQEQAEVSTTNPEAHLRESDWKDPVWDNFHAYGSHIDAARHLSPPASFYN